VTNLIALHSFGARPFCLIVGCMYFEQDKQTDFSVAIKAAASHRPPYAEVCERRFVLSFGAGGACRWVLIGLLLVLLQRHIDDGLSRSLPKL
jgi:hypothetical protein